MAKGLSERSKPVSGARWLIRSTLGEAMGETCPKAETFRQDGTAVAFDISLFKRETDPGIRLRECSKKVRLSAA